MYFIVEFINNWSKGKRLGFNQKQLHFKPNSLIFKKRRRIFLEVELSIQRTNYLSEKTNVEQNSLIFHHER